MQKGLRKRKQKLKMFKRIYTYYEGYDNSDTMWNVMTPIQYNIGHCLGGRRLHVDR